MSSLPADTVSLERALHTYVTNASSLGATFVRWSQQAAPDPGVTWISLNILAVEGVGQDWLDLEADTIGDTYTMYARGMRAGRLSIQCFGPTASPVGVASPRAVLERVRSALHLPTAAALLDAAGVSISNFGPVSTLGGVVNGALFEPRATLEARFYLMSQVSETATYIETAVITGEADV